MFYHIRFQTGESMEVAAELKKGSIPCVDVTDNDELSWFLKKLEEYSVYKVEGLPYDRNARDRIKEPEFEFRVAFSGKPANAGEVEKKDLMFIDFYFEPDFEETYDPAGEM